MPRQQAQSFPFDGIDMRTTIRQWAAMVGISRQSGYRAVERCGIPVDVCGGIDPDEATALYRERTRPRANLPRVAQHDAHEARFRRPRSSAI